MKEASSVKLQNENRSYCLLQKLSKAQVGCQNKEYNKIFKHINQNITELKKYELIKDSENIFAYWKESKKSEMLVYKFGLFKIQLGDLGGSTTPANKIAL